MATNPELVGDGPIYQIFAPEAETLAKLSGIKLDLEFARNFLLEAAKIPTSNVKWALINAAHISYRRAFNRNPNGLDLADVESLGVSDLERHNYHWNQANKLVAHSANAFDMCHVGVEIKDGGWAAIRTVGTRYAGLPDTDMPEWIDLILRLQDGPLDQKINAAFNAVQAWLAQQSPHEIMKGPLITDFEPSPPKSAAGKGRR